MIKSFHEEGFVFGFRLFITRTFGFSVRFFVIRKTHILRTHEWGTGECVKGCNFARKLGLRTWSTYMPQNCKHSTKTYKAYRDHFLCVSNMSTTPKSEKALVRGFFSYQFGSKTHSKITNKLNFCGNAFRKLVLIALIRRYCSNKYRLYFQKLTQKFNLLKRAFIVVRIRMTHTV